MDRINSTRVVVGGIAAGLVINVSEFILNGIVLAQGMDAVMARMNLPPIGGSQIATFMVLSFGLGIAMVWLYAAIRPRFGSGPTTAIYAGLAAWGLACLYPNLSMGVAGMLPAGMLAIATVWALAEMIVGALLGAYLYQEVAAGTPARA